MVRKNKSSSEVAVSGVLLWVNGRKRIEIFFSSSSFFFFQLGNKKYLTYIPDHQFSHQFLSSSFEARTFSIYPRLFFLYLVVWRRTWLLGKRPSELYLSWQKLPGVLYLNMKRYTRERRQLLVYWCIGCDGASTSTFGVLVRRSHRGLKLGKMHWTLDGCVVSRKKYTSTLQCISPGG